MKQVNDRLDKQNKAAKAEKTENNQVRTFKLVVDKL